MARLSREKSLPRIRQSWRVKVQGRKVGRVSKGAGQQLRLQRRRDQGPPR